MLLNVALFVAGVAWLQQQPELPSVLWVYPFAAAVLAWSLLPAAGGRDRLFLRRAGTSSLWFAGGFLWAALVAHVKLADYLPPEWEGRDVSVRGVIADLPEVTDRGARFEFDVGQVNTPLARVPRHIAVFWYAEGSGTPPASLHAGERWDLTVRLRRPHGLANPNGFDFEAWLLERGIRATGYVRAEPSNRLLQSMVWRPSYVVERAREWIRNRIASALPGESSAGVLVALGSAISRPSPAATGQCLRGPA